MRKNAPKRGRRKLSRDERRSVAVQMLLKPAEYDSIYDEADKAGVPVATWCRMKILELLRLRER